jgi:hypothetical protein
MINQGNDVPENTIAVFVDEKYIGFDYKDIDTIFSLSSKKRDWFDPHFYKCLPLTIANQYGFVLKSQFDFTVSWDGGDSPESIKFFFTEPLEEVNKKFPRIESHFGHGVFTVVPPFTIRTPPGINIMTINTPNSILPNITVMTGVVETDNLRHSFTFNFKIQQPGVDIFIPKGYPLATVIPIPRYFVENFELKDSKNIFSKELVDEEYEAKLRALSERERMYKEENGATDKNYLNGKDVYGNSFPDHQGPSLKRFPL